MRHRTTLLCLLFVATLAGCVSSLRWNPLSSLCAHNTGCYGLEGRAQAECLSRCDRGR